MATRSRKGCIDCKQAKIKCDEVHPFCGTCARRLRQCRGYRQPPPRASALRETRMAQRAGLLSALEPGTVVVDLPSGPATLMGTTSPAASPAALTTGTTEATEKVEEAEATLEAHWMPDPDTFQVIDSPTSANVVVPHTEGRAQTLVWETTSTQWLSPIRGPSFLPCEILAADQPFIELYFMRHPSEMVMSNGYFIDEMNGAVMAVMQQCPTAVGESLCAIGENYVEQRGGSTTLISNRRSRLLARVRLLNEDESSPELVLLLLLGLCGAELTDPHADGRGSALPALIDNVALTLDFHTRAGRELNGSAKYFAKGVARQDMLRSLAGLRRPRINPSHWLDEYCLRHADRLLGLTSSLFPLLYRLAGLAEDVQAVLEGGSPDASARPDLVEREAALRAQLLVWRPVPDPAMGMDASRQLLLHASAWRSAALLYLYRLFNRPGSSAEADRAALNMAYEVMMHISGPAEDVKLSLWPLFLAACELSAPEDRALAARLFSDVYRARPIRTTKRTRAFCVDEVWPARDGGRVWDWMQLSRRNAFVPL